MELDDAVRLRRTHKVYGGVPVDRETLIELFELATWVPNHHVTNPWRFRVLGPDALERLKHAQGDPVSAKKFDRAPTLVAVTALSAPEASDAEREEDLMACACAAYTVLLGATAKGLASYWRTPGVLKGPAGREALGIEPSEQIVGLLHLGEPRQQPRTPDRADVQALTVWLD